MNIATPTHAPNANATAKVVDLPAELDGSTAFTDSRLIQFDFLRATEMAAVNCLSWIGKGDKVSADAAACDAIRGVFDAMDIRGEIVIGEGIKDEAPGLFTGERVGRWRDGTPRVDIAIDPLDGTTNLSKGLPNSISCIAAAIRDDDNVPALQYVPAFYMKKLAYPAAVRRAWIKDSNLPLSIDAPLSEVISLTARLLDKSLRDVVVMVLDRPRNAQIIEEVRAAGAQLRMIVDGDIAAALGPAMPSSGIDLYVGIGGAPEGILAAAGLRCMGGGMQAQMWPRDEEERASLAQCGWSDRVEKVYRSRDLVHSNDVLFIATGISDSPLLRGAHSSGMTAVTHSVLMRQQSGSIRFITTEHDLAVRPLRLRSTSLHDGDDATSDESASSQPNLRSSAPSRHTPSAAAEAGKVPCLLLFGPPGSGKGTIGSAIGALPGYTHCSTGDLVRKAIRRYPDVPHQWNEVTSGRLLSDGMMWKLFDEYLSDYLRSISHGASGERLILDGIPRSLAQVAELNKRVTVTKVLHFNCEDPNTLIDRITRRFHQGGRPDDETHEVIEARLRVYNEQTQPILDLYPPEIVHSIDSSDNPQAVLMETLRILAPASLFN